VLTDGGFVTVQWGFFILGRIGETPNTRGHSIVGLLEMTGPLFKLTTTSTDNTVKAGVGSGLSGCQ
jgi:hypothetical protein